MLFLKVIFLENNKRKMSHNLKTLLYREESHRIPLYQYWTEIKEKYRMKTYNDLFDKWEKLSMIIEEKRQSLGQTDRQAIIQEKRESSLASRSWTHKNKISKIQIILQRSFMLEHKT